MSDNSIVTEIRNPLAAALLDTIRTAREHDERAYDLASELANVRALYVVAIDLLRVRDKQTDRLRESNIHLRQQLRAVMNGTTATDERYEAEHDAMAEWAKWDAA